MKYCSQCGHEMDDDMLFCQKCGARYEEKKQPDIIEENAGEYASTQSRSKNGTSSADWLNKIIAFIRAHWEIITAIILGLTFASKILSWFHSSNGIVFILLAAMLAVGCYFLVIRIRDKIIAYRDSDDRKAMLNEDIQRVKDFCVNAWAFAVKHKKIVIPAASVCAISILVLCIIAGPSNPTPTPPSPTPTTSTSTEATPPLDVPTQSVPESTHPEETDPPVDGENVVNIEIQCEANWFFSKYDLDVIIDGKKQGRLDHGESKTFQFHLDDGQHELTLVKDGDNEVKGTISFTITDNTDIQYKVVCHSNNISITLIQFEDMSPPTENTTTYPEETEPPVDGENVVNIEIQCEANWFFNKYDLDVIIDGEKLESLDHGETKTFQFHLDDGRHELTLAKQGGDEVKGTISFTITDNSDIQYKAVCYGTYVEVTLIHFENMRPLTENETKIPNNSKYYTKNRTYKEVEAELKNLGFTNIVTKVLRDLSEYEESSVGKVESVSIGGKTSFDSGEIFDKSVQIIITYHDFEPTSSELWAIVNSHIGEPAEKVIAAFKDTGYTIIYCVQGKEVTNFKPEGYILESGSIDTSKKTARLDFTTQELIDMANALEEFLPQHMALRVAVVAMTNGQATDVFKKDGYTYNPSKFHSYSDISGFYLSVVSSGTWEVVDEHTWHVSDMKCMMSGYSTYLKASMDITFDGKNYIVSNVDKTIAAKDYIDSTDPSKVNTEHLEPSDANPFLTVSPSLVEKDRDASAEEAQNNKTMPTTTRTNWISSQFSFWTGEHKQLKELIKSNLNDEKSYDHTDTTYYDLMSQELVDVVNDILKSAGYSQRAKVGDLFIICEFTAKNAFNATIKCTAYAIVHYDSNTIELIGIE